MLLMQRRLLLRLQLLVRLRGRQRQLALQMVLLPRESVGAIRLAVQLQVVQELPRLPVVLTPKSN